MSVTGDNSLMFATGLDNSGLKRGAFEATGIVQGMANKISKINPFAALAVGALGAFAIIGNGALKMSSDFETAMKEVQTISSATEDNFEGISKQVFALSSISPDGPEKLAKAYYQIVSAGQDGADGIKVLETATKAAVAGVTDTITAADGITTILNAFKLDATEAEAVADSMFTTVRLGKTTFSELAASISQVAPIAAASGISFNEVSAAVATLTKQGVPTAQAMTQIRAAIISANEVLGDGAFNALTLQEAFQELYKEANGSQTKLTSMVGRVEAVSAILGVAGDNAEGAAKDLNEFSQAAGASEKAFETMAKTNINQWKILGNNIKGTVKGLGDSLLSISSGTAKFLNDSLFKQNKLLVAYESQRKELFLLKTQLSDTNLKENERKEIIDKIVKAYPSYLKGLDIEKSSNQDLIGILDKVASAYQSRFKFSSAQQDLNDAVEKGAQLNIDVDTSKDNFRKQLALLESYLDEKYQGKANLLSDIDFSKSDREILDFVTNRLKEIGEVREAQTRNGKQLIGESTTYLNSLTQEVLRQDNITNAISEQTKEISKKKKVSNNATTQFLNDARNELEILELINKAKKASDLEQYKASDLDSVKVAVKERENTLDALNKISQISREQFKQNPKILKEYIESENKEIKELAEKRKAALEYVPNFNLDTSDNKKLETEIDKYNALLDKKRELYSLYEGYITTLGKEAANERFKDLLAEGDTYENYLKLQLDKFQEVQDKKDAIIKSFQDAGIRVNEIDTSDIDDQIKKLEESLNESQLDVHVDFNLDLFLESRNKANDQIDSIRELKLKKLAATEQDLDKKTIKKRKEAILKESDELLKAVKNQSLDLLKDAPIKLLDQAFDEMGLTFQNLNNLTFKQLDKIGDKIKAISLNSGKLLDLGLNQAQVDALLKSLELYKKASSDEITEAETLKLGGAFGNVGEILSQAGDDFSRSVGEMANQIGNVISLMGDSNASTSSKISGWVGLISHMGNLMRELGSNVLNKNVNAQKEINKGLVQQLALEAKINALRRERDEIQRNSSAFLDSYYKEDFAAAIRQQLESETELNRALKDLSENGIFSAEGDVKRLLFGRKQKVVDFSIKDIIGDFDVKDLHEQEGFLWDPLGALIFGAYSENKVAKDALKNLREAFDETLEAMGKSMEDMVNFSSEDWLDFLSLMEASGHITDESTIKMLESAKESLRLYQEAVEEMRDIISDFAGGLGDSLSDALVSAFQDGTDAADNFMNSINDVINNLFLNELINSQFRKYFDDLQKEMEASFGAEGDQNWIDDIQRFAQGISPAMDGAVEAMRIFNEEMQALGYEGFGGPEDNRSGLAGGISAITEDTANILAGTLNAMYLDIRQGLEYSEESLSVLKKIDANTQYNKHLETMDVKLSDIKTALGG